jgi:AhpD family alkylhydroperoxidase
VQSTVAGGDQTVRIDIQRLAPEVMEALAHVDEPTRRFGLDARLPTLVKLRVSQFNGCAYCTDMHSKDAAALGEDGQRLHLLAVWREAPGFTPREQAALAWAEALTLLPQLAAADDRFQELARQFSSEEVAGLTLAIIATNEWNRLCRAAQIPAGQYVSPYRAGAHAAS